MQDRGQARREHGIGRGDERGTSTSPGAGRHGGWATPSGRVGPVQGTLLLLGSCCPVLSAVLITPVLPLIQQHFAGTFGAAAMVPLVLVLPALFIALLAPFAGVLADRLGRNRLLVGALIVFAVAGTAPAWLPSLPLILLSRAVLGVAASVICTCCTILLAEYFTGERRERYLGLQVVATSLAATALFVLGGALGELSWRLPFWVYAVSLLLAPAMARLLPAEELDATSGAVPSGSGAEARSPGVTSPALSSPTSVSFESTAASRTSPEPPTESFTAVAPGEAVSNRAVWQLIVLPCALTLIGGVLFYVVPTQLGLVLEGWGITSPSVAGIITGGAALATAIGGFLAGSLVVRRFWVLLPIQFGLAAVGLLMLGAAGDVVGVATAGAIVASAGGGLLITTLLIWTIRLLDIGRRGLGAGAWVAAFFLGQFLCPLLMLALVDVTGRTLQATITLFGIVAALMVGVSAVLALSPRIRALAQPPASGAAVTG